MSLSFLLQVTDGSPSETGVENVPLWDIVADASQGFGLIIMLSLAAMFAYSIFIFVERFLALRKATKEEKGLLIKVMCLGHNFVCDKNKHLITS